MVAFCISALAISPKAVSANIRVGVDSSKCSGSHPSMRLTTDIRQRFRPCCDQGGRRSRALDIDRTQLSLETCRDGETDIDPTSIYFLIVRVNWDVRFLAHQSIGEEIQFPDLAVENTITLRIKECPALRYERHLTELRQA
jgi:hypothetical protein